MTPGLELSLKQVGASVEAHVNDFKILIKGHGNASRITKTEMGEITSMRTDDVVRHTSVDKVSEKIVKQFKDEVNVLLTKKRSRKRSLVNNPGAEETDQSLEGSKVQKKYDEKGEQEYDGDTSDNEIVEVNASNAEPLVMALSSASINAEDRDVGEPSTGPQKTSRVRKTEG